jgi:hypothetical protein
MGSSTRLLRVATGVGWWTPGLQGENDANWESIARRTRRGIGDWVVDTGASGRERRELGKASHGGRGGGLGVGWWTPGLQGENDANWESIAQRTRRTQRGIGGLQGENDANWGKHRTEDTEDTEGDWGASGRERRELGKASCGGHGGHEGGLGVGWWTPGLISGSCRICVFFSPCYTAPINEGI